MSINRGYYNAQAAQVLNKVEYDSNSNPVGLIESSTDGSSCNFGTDRLPRRGGCYRGDSTWLINPNNLNLSTSTITVGCWYLWSGVTSTNYSTILGINHWNTGLSNIGITLFKQSNSTKIYLSIIINKINTTRLYESSTDWTHYTISYSRIENVLNFYTNGVLTESIQTSIDTSSDLDLKFNPFYHQNRTLVSGDKKFSVQAFSRILTASEVYDLYKGYSTNCYVNYKCDENYGTTCYDSSGNGNHGTIVNAITVTPEENPNSIHQYQDIYSYHNEVGYNKSGSVFIPRNESITLPPLKDVLGNNLTYFGKVPGRAKFVESNCFQQQTSATYMAVSGLLATDTVQVFGSSAVPTLSAGRMDFVVGNKYYGISIYRSGVLWAYYPMCESIINPSGHIYHDVSGNGNHATLINGVVGNEGKQNEFHYLQKGFNIYENLFSYSETFSNSYWATRMVTKTLNQSDFDGGTNAVLLTCAGTSDCELRTTDYVNYVHALGCRVYVKSGTGNYFYIRNFSGASTALFTLSTNAVSISGSASNVLEASIIDVGNDWKLCTLLSTKSMGGNYQLFSLGFGNGTTATQSYTGDTLYIYKPHLFKTSIKDYVNYIKTPSTAISETQLPKLSSSNFDVYNKSLTHQQDGKSFLPSGCNLRQYQQPSLIQADSTTKFWFDANNEPYDVEYKNLRLVDPIGDRIYIGNKNANFISPISTHATSLLTRQKNTEKVVRNVVDDPAIDDATFSHDVTVAAGDLTYSLYNPSGWTFNALINWGDGTTQLVNTTATQTITKTYSVAGTYTVKVTGRMSYMYPSNVSAANALKVVKINNWGDCGIYRLSFNACQNLVSIPVGPITGLHTGYDLSSLFNLCYKLTGQIQSDLFINAPLTTNLSNLFNGCLLLTGQIPENLFRYCPNLTTVASAFQGCTGLTGQIPEELLRYNTKLTTVAGLFSGCTGLSGSIPENLLKYNILLTNASSILQGCSKITGQIPSALLTTLTELTTIDSLFGNCIGLTSTIPVDFLRYNTKLTTAASSLLGCTGITGNIPVDYFRYNVLLTNVSRHFRNTRVSNIPSGLFQFNTAITTYVGVFQECVNITTIPTDLFRYSGTNTLTFEVAFDSCTGITSIPIGLFDYNTNVTTFASTFRNTRITTIPSNLFINNVNVTSFSYTFAANPSLTAIPSNLFDTNTLVTTFDNVFNGCTGITSIPVDLFRYNTLVTNMAGVFRGTRITSVPLELFRYNTEVISFAYIFGALGTTSQLTFDVDIFRYNTKVTNMVGVFALTGVKQLYSDLFKYNVNITTFNDLCSGCRIYSGGIPSGLFTFNTKVTDFSYAFTATTGIASIPSNLFDTNTLVTSFGGLFQANIGFTSIPVDLFKYNTAVVSFANCFYLASNLSSLPEDLFYYNNNVTNYINCFSSTRNLVLPTRLFNIANLSKVTNWANFLNVTSMTYSPTGTIQKIWDVSEGGDVTYTTPPTKTDAFNNCTALTNYSSIPTAWQ